MRTLSAFAVAAALCAATAAIAGPNDPPDADPSAAAVIERINLHRKTAGLAPVTLDAALSGPCAAHAGYLLAHDARVWSRERIDPHDERPELEGYSDDGRKAARAAIIAWVEPVLAIDNHMEGHFHRVPLLDPGLQRIGVGVARGGKYGWVCVFDVTRGSGTAANRPECVLWPCDGQKDVPTHYYLEMPDPIPMAADKRVGNPVTATFAPSCKVATVVATLTQGPKAQPVELWLTTPESPADRIYQRNTVALFPKAPLAPKTLYTATVTCTVNGKPWSKTWSFTTSAKGPTRRPH